MARDYSVAIRTLGRAGDYYQKTLDSIISQTVKPKAIHIYIAEGYDLPPQTIGIERIIRVPKGMVAQRALSYDEIDTEFILFLDDDVFLPTNAVETLFNELEQNHGDVIAPIVFDNNGATLREKIVRTLTGREVCRPWDGRWANKVLLTAGFSYNGRPSKAVYESQTNAGPCFFCRKSTFLNIHFEEELWLEKTPYAFPEDQVMFYKMYLLGNKVLSTYDTGIIHMDASTTVSNSEEKTLKIIYSEYRNKLIFWHRFIYLPSGITRRLFAVAALLYAMGIQSVKFSLLRLKGNKGFADSYCSGVREGIRFLNSEDYKSIPRL